MIIICLILYFSISLFVYLVIVGGSLDKSEYEKKLEDEEQLKYIENYKKDWRIKNRWKEFL